MIVPLCFAPFFRSARRRRPRPSLVFISALSLHQLQLINHNTLDIIHPFHTLQETGVHEYKRVQTPKKYF